MSDLTGKQVLVTGATSGIGKVAARELKGMGATVVALGRDPAKLAALASELRIETLQCALSSLAATRRPAADYRPPFPNRPALLDTPAPTHPKPPPTPACCDT